MYVGNISPNYGTDAKLSCRPSQLTIIIISPHYHPVIRYVIDIPPQWVLPSEIWIFTFALARWTDVRMVSTLSGSINN